MTLRHAHIGLAGALALTAAFGATAQTRPAAAAPAPAAPAPTIAHGPALPGVCVISTEEATVRSQVGQWVGTRLRQLAQQADAEVSPEQTQLNTDLKAFQAKRPTLDAASLQTQGQALQTRISAIQQKGELLERELQATRQKALNRVSQELQPIVQQLYQQRRCSIIIFKEAAPLENPDMDLTPAAITQLNSKIQQFSFEREHLDAAAPQQR